MVDNPLMFAAARQLKRGLWVKIYPCILANHANHVIKPWNLNPAVDLMYMYRTPSTTCCLPSPVCDVLGLCATLFSSTSSYSPSNLVKKFIPPVSLHVFINHLILYEFLSDFPLPNLQRNVRKCSQNITCITMLLILKLFCKWTNLYWCSHSR